MALEFGIREGLAQDLGFNNAVNDLRYNEQMKKQANQLAEQQAKLFADDFQYNNALNQFDNPRVKQLAQLQIKKIGRFVNENPDWRTNIEKRAMYSSMIHDLKDNPELNRGLMVDQSKKELYKDMAEKIKNPAVYNSKGFELEKQRLANYEKYGNPDGEEAAKKEGIKPYVYQAPRDFVDLTEAGLKAGNAFNDFDAKPLKGGGLGAYQEVPKEGSLNAAAFDFYRRNKEQMDQEAPNLGISPIDYAKRLVSAGIKTKKDYGDYGALIAMGKWREEKNGQKQPIEGVWSKDIVNTNKSVVNGELLKDAIGAKPPLVLQSDDGKQGIDLTGNEVDYTGFSTYLGNDKKQGIKHFAIQTKIPKAKAMELGLVQDAAGIGTGDEVAPEWRKKAKLETVTDKNGNDVEYVTITDLVPIDVNKSSFQQVYDNKASVDKFVESPKNTYQNSTPKHVVQNGITYTYNEQTGKYE